MNDQRFAGGGDFDSDAALRLSLAQLVFGGALVAENRPRAGLLRLALVVLASARARPIGPVHAAANTCLRREGPASALIEREDNALAILAAAVDLLRSS